MKKTEIFLVLAMALALFVCREVKSEEKEEMDERGVLDEMQKVYDDVKTITAGLDMETLSLIFDERSKREGRVYLKKPEEFRWDIEKPYEKRFYLSRERAIEYFPDKKLAKIYNLKGESGRIGEASSKAAALAILESPKKLEEYFKITLEGKETEEEGKKEYYKLDLVPKDDSVESDYERMIFFVNAKSWIPEKMEAYEGEDAIHYFRFHDIELNSKIKDSVFEFKITKDMIIDEYPKKEQ